MFKRKVVIRLLIITLGLGLVLFSLFAHPLGLGNGPGLGPRQLQMLGAGIIMILFGASYWITPVLTVPLQRADGPASNLKESKASTAHGSRPTNLWLMLIAGLALLVYVWIITIGRMDRWPSGRNYFWMLAQGFEKGQTSLLVKPPAALLKLANPYDLSQRKGIDYLWDTSLYHGKYYLYWGPVPAVMAMLVNLVTQQPVTDAGLVLFFVAGTVLFSVLLLRKLYQDGVLPGWVFWGGVLACACNIPLIWLFTDPAYYEASIAGGQFFMMGGFFLLYLAYRSSPMRIVYVSLSALAFGLAGGTRINLLPSVLFLGLMILLRVYVVYRQNLRSAVTVFAAAFIPLAIVALSLMSYNYTRFGSVFEFGHNYQLTGLANSGAQVSIHYAMPSMYSYFFRPPSLKERFPFITVPGIKEKMWPFFIHLPKNYYYAEPSAGLLLVVPLIGFTAFLLLRWLWLLLNGDASLASIPYKEHEVRIWFGASLMGYALFQTALLLLFVSTSMRYLVDITPAWIVLACMFVGMYISLFEKNGYWQKAIMVLWLVTAGLTVIAGLLIGVTGGQNNFLNKNPQLYYQLLDWFRR